MTNNTEIQIETKLMPFSISFAWKNKSVKVELKNGEDVFIFAQGLAIFLDRYNIEYTLSEHEIIND